MTKLAFNLRDLCPEMMCLTYQGVAFVADREIHTISVGFNLGQIKNRTNYNSLKCSMFTMLGRPCLSESLPILEDIFTYYDPSLKLAVLWDFVLC